MVLVCANERDPASGKSSCGRERGSDLRRWLRDRCREAGLTDQVLCSTVRCLGVCSPMGVTVAIIDRDVGGGHLVVSEGPEDHQRLWEMVCGQGRQG